MNSLIPYSTRLVLFASLVISSTALHASEMQFDFAVRYHSGTVTGFLQTPDGGEPDRSDIKRPTFRELDIDRISGFATDLTLRWGANRVIAGADFIDVSERNILSSDLLSQWQQFHAGDSVSSDVQLDWYRLGYLRELSNRDSTVRYAVGGDVTLFSFHYELTNGTLEVDRRYNKAGYRLGATVDVDLSDAISLELSGFFPLQGGAAAEITSLDLSATYAIGTTLSAIAGVEYLKISFRDKQTFPNHIEAEFSPRLYLGLKTSL